MKPIKIKVLYVIEKNGIYNDNSGIKLAKIFKLSKEDEMTLTLFKNEIKNEVENCAYKCFAEDTYKGV